MHGAAVLSVATPTMRGAPWPSQPHAESSTLPARCQHAWHRPPSSVLHQPPPHRTATWRAAPLLAPRLTKARAAAPRPFRLGGQAARRVRLPLAARTGRPAWSRPAFCRSNAGAPPRVEASAACMPGNAGAGVAEPGCRLRAGTSPWRSCRRDRAQGKFGGIDKDPGCKRIGQSCIALLLH